MPVDALLAQDGHAGLSGFSGSSGFSGYSGIRIVCELEGEPGIGLVEAVVVLFLRRGGVVAERLHAVGRLAPRATDGGDIRRENATTPDVDRESAVARGRADHVYAVAEARATEDGEHFVELFISYLQHRARFLGEENRQRIERVAGGIRIWQRHGEPLAAGDRHLGERHGHATIRAVVVGERKTALHDLLHRVEERLHGLRIGIRVFVAELVVHLREAAAAKTVRTPAEINKDEMGFSITLLRASVSLC